MIGRFLNIFQLSAVQKAQRTVDKGFLDRAGIGGKGRGGVVGRGQLKLDTYGQGREGRERGDQM